MAAKSIQMTDNGGNASYPIAAIGLGTAETGSWTYTGFARVPKGTTYNFGILLVAGYDAASVANSQYGAAIIQICNVSNAMRITATKIAPNATANVKFGYWDGGDGYWYIGVYSPGYRVTLSVTPLVVHPNAARRVTIDNYYPYSTTAPTGWTEVAFTTL